MRSILQSKRGAIELSMTTVVIIVLAMTMLILGLTLIRSIFTGATQSVTDINDKVKAQINSLFSEQEQADVVVLLGSDHIAKVPANTLGFGVLVSARTVDGSVITSRNRLQYTLTLDESSDCITKNSRVAVESWFAGKLGKALNIDQYSGDTSYSSVIFNIPKGTALCSQKVFVDFKDAQNPQSSPGGSFFIIQVTRAGVFG